MDSQDSSPGTPFPASSLQPPASDVTGWKLDEAKAFLERDGSTPEASIVLIETDPSQRKNSLDTFGDWRVLRCRTDENQNLELTVARELLSENRAGSARP